jgi:hypothetical protein
MSRIHWKSLQFYKENIRSTSKHELLTFVVEPYPGDKNQYGSMLIRIHNTGAGGATTKQRMPIWQE